MMMLDSEIGVDDTGVDADIKMAMHV